MATEAIGAGWTRRWSWRRTDRGARPEGGPAAEAPPLLDRVLRMRGLGDADVRRAFMEPSLHDLHDPARLPGANRAAERLVDAVRGGERVVIYGDYDVDGITATAILYHVLRAAAPEQPPGWYVPHRLDEGYGLNPDALRQLADDGASVVVSVDCGVTATAAAAAARDAGLDLIITDHHLPPADGAPLPDAVAIVHPSIEGSEYPFQELCGAGVAFKVAWAFARAWCGSERVSKAFQEVLVRMLPMVALGTIADVVPLVGENRVLASHGLRTMRSTPVAGLQSLIDRAGLRGARIDSDKVGFVLGPRLNACGRLGHAADAIRLFTDADASTSEAIADRLCSLNDRRQRTEKRIVEQACAMAEEQGQLQDGHRAIVLAHDDWHAGVVGIVCSRLVERFGRPTILLQRQDGVCRGSARSVDGFHLHDALTVCTEHLVTYGGHAAAAGMTLDADRLDDFRAAFVAEANRLLTPEDLVPEQRVDVEGGLPELDLETVAALAALAPFGRGNPRPVVLLRRVRLAAAPRQLRAGQDLKLFLSDPDGIDRRQVPAVWWNAGAEADRLHRGDLVDAVVTPRISTWSGRAEVELEIRDLANATAPDVTVVAGGSSGVTTPVR